ncbi:hypothetical protein BJV78DRAFT_561372 [Lactifluus subvellereus]|nr:hypothetical protein BJV78DRAFT_561372 [Lactifluus subvellereus]
MIFPSLALLSGFALFSSAVAKNTWQIIVGNATGGIIFTPNNITAATGDIVVFTFNPKNHTVTQSTFNSPCTHKTYGFDSLFYPVGLGTTSGFPTFNITVNDTNPIWVYCRQGEFTAASHCGKGMVFAVNPGAEGTNNSFSAFLAAAKAVGASLASSAVSSSVSSTGTPTLAVGPSSNPTTTTKGATSPSSTIPSGETPSTTTPNGAISLNVEGSLFVAVVGMVFGFLA